MRYVCGVCLVCVRFDHETGYGVKHVIRRVTVCARVERVRHDGLGKLSRVAPIVLLFRHGHAPFFVPPLSWAMSRRSEALHALAREVASAQQVHYVRLLKPRDQDPFVTRSQELNAADGLHPSSAGYAEWYRELVAQGGLNGLTP